MLLLISKIAEIINKYAGKSCRHDSYLGGL
jgi:hypothetical protein